MSRATSYQERCAKCQRFSTIDRSWYQKENIGRLNNWKSDLESNTNCIGCFALDVCTPEIYGYTWECRHCTPATKNLSTHLECWSEDASGGTTTATSTFSMCIAQ